MVCLQVGLLELGQQLCPSEECDVTQRRQLAPQNGSSQDRFVQERSISRLREIHLTLFRLCKGMYGFANPHDEGHGCWMGFSLSLLRYGLFSFIRMSGAIPF